MPYSNEEEEPVEVVKPKTKLKGINSVYILIYQLTLDSAPHIVFWLNNVYMDRQTKEEDFKSK